MEEAFIKVSLLSYSVFSKVKNIYVICCQITYHVSKTLLFPYLVFLKMKKNIFYLAFLSLIACKKAEPLLSVDCAKPTNKEAICKKLILGKWEWVRTETRFNPPYVFGPEMIGHKVALNFKSDSIVEGYIDGQLKDVSKYEIFDAGLSFKRDSGITYIHIRGCQYFPVNSIEFYQSARVAVLKVCDDTLYLPFEDKIYHTGNDIFSRVK
jgi:hypothetical protein